MIAIMVKLYLTKRWKCMCAFHVKERMLACSHLDVLPFLSCLFTISCHSDDVPGTIKPAPFALIHSPNVMYVTSKPKSTIHSQILQTIPWFSLDLFMCSSSADWLNVAPVYPHHFSYPFEYLALTLSNVKPWHLKPFSQSSHLHFALPLAAPSTSDICPLSLSLLILIICPNHFSSLSHTPRTTTSRTPILVLSTYLCILSSDILFPIHLMFSILLN